MLKEIETRFVSHNSADMAASWHHLPDFGYDSQVPFFVGALSYKTPKSLKAGLNNWNSTIFAWSMRSKFKGFFVHLNDRSREDDMVVAPFATHFNRTGLPTIMTGRPGLNWNVGKVIAHQCRLAEESEASHPNGENVMLWLEKDWQVNASYGPDFWNELVMSANEVLQRGVVKLNMRPDGSPPFTWPCRGENYTWTCAPGWTHHNMNSPMFIRCDWFLRYYEAFALFDQSVMNAWGRTGKNRTYYDWEEAQQDGRVEWINSHWILGASQHGDLFSHVEIDDNLY